VGGWVDFVMLSKEIFDLVKYKYGHYASWAVWSDEGEKPKDNIGDISILDPDANPHLLEDLNPNIVIVGLNIGAKIQKPLANFHSPNHRALDFKLRFSFKKTPLWGSYMTDIIKDFEQKISGKVINYLSANKQFEKDNVDIFREELFDLGSNNPKLVSCGGAVHSILKRNFNNEFQIYRIPHYSHFISKENYKKEVDAMLMELVNCVS